MALVSGKEVPYLQAHQVPDMVDAAGKEDHRKPLVHFTEVLNDQ